MGKKPKRKKRTKELKKLLKVKSDELDAMVKKAPEGWDPEKAQYLSDEIRVINEKISEVGKPKFQQRFSNITDRIEDIRRKAEKTRHEHFIHNHVLREINQKILEKENSLPRCPECGIPDQGNRMNGKPWCFKCQTPFSNAKKENIVKFFKRKYPENLTFKPLEA